MFHRARVSTASILALLLAACSDSGDRTYAISNLVDVVTEPAGANCASGGRRIESGADANANGALDREEVTSTAYACNGVGAGPTLVSVVAEAAGANCPLGGNMILAGTDANEDGVLDSTEVGSTSYICNSAAGSEADTTPVAVSAEAAGANCSLGGHKVTAGSDTDIDGVLDDAEVASTSYICNTDPGGDGAVDTLIAVVAEPSGIHCSYGGNKVTSGPDANGNGTLDSTEVSATNYVCNAAPGPGIAAWIEVTDPSVQAASNTGYLVNGVDQITITLPADPAVGDMISISGIGAGGWKIAQNAGQTIQTDNLAGGTLGKDWVIREYARSWWFAAMSADGTRLVATAFDDFIYTSTDSGMTWTPRDAQRHWTGVASSADGFRLAATDYTGRIHTSVDAGLSWTARGPALSWRSIASSADGMKLVAVAQDAPIYVSIDAGVTLTTAGPTRTWRSVASSSDGTRLIAAAGSSELYVSSDSGATWSASAHVSNWTAVASSADGMRLIAAENIGYLHTSADAGATWTARGPSTWWGNGVASSADGSRLIAVGDGGVHVSTDAGATWTRTLVGTTWYSATASRDGSRFIVLDSGGQIHISTPTLMSATSVGVGGSISGRVNDAIDLQYVGGGTFIVRGSAGVFDIR